jgi:hypothetical protein
VADAFHTHIHNTGENILLLHLVPNMTESANRLCQRCRKLDLASYLVPSDERPGEEQLIALVAKRESDPTCPLCAIFLVPMDSLPPDRKGSIIFWMPNVPGTIGGFSMITHNGSKFNTDWLLPTEHFDNQHGPENKIESSPLRTAQRWLKMCQANPKHAACREIQEQWKDSLEVIDCYGRTLCSITSTSGYVALSYVWGNKKEEESGSGALNGNLPATIEDAITVTLELGFRYLWVDRYCIDQTDAAEKHQLVNSMDMIYKGAELTIVAAAGNDPSYGLPGISTRQRRQQHTVTVDHCKLRLFLGPGREIEESRWSSRAWTYQEMLLSRRRLVFTESQAYFQCVAEGHVEWLCSFERDDDLAFPNPVNFAFSCNHPCKSTVFPMKMYGLRHNLSISDRIQEYYTRHLSYDLDVLSGIGGIFNDYRTAGDIQEYGTFNHFWGVPILIRRKYSYPLQRKHNDRSTATDSFVAGLLWNVERQQGSGARPVPRSGIWPSWSWISMKSGRLRNCITQEWVKNTMNYQEDLSVWFSSRVSDARILCHEFANRQDDYTQFHPFIDVESWIMTQRTEEVHLLVPMQHRYQRVYWGPLANHEGSANEGADIVAIYLGAKYVDYIDEADGVKKEEITIYCLLVREDLPGLFRRVGMVISAVQWTEDHPKHEAGVVPWFLDSLAERGKDRLGRRKWQKRMVRII